MSLFNIPEELLEFGGSDWYPIGEYEGEIEEVYSNDLAEDDDGNPYQGFQTSDGEQLSLQFGGFTPLAGAEEAPGNDKVFVKVCLKDGSMDVHTVDAKDKDYQQLAKGKRRLAALAQALGYEGSDAVEFVDDLRNGAFNGKRFGIKWQKWTQGKGDNKRSGAFPAKFFATRENLTSMF